MTKQQADAIRALVDAGGWNAVRANAELWAVWKADRKAAKEYINVCVDR